MHCHFRFDFFTISRTCKIVYNIPLSLSILYLSLCKVGITTFVSICFLLLQRIKTSKKAFVAVLQLLPPTFIHLENDIEWIALTLWGYRSQRYFDNNPFWQHPGFGPEPGTRLVSLFSGHCKGGHSKENGEQWNIVPLLVVTTVLGLFGWMNTFHCCC